MVLKPCLRLRKQPMVLLYMIQEGLENGFKTMCKASLKNPWFQEGLGHGFKTMYGGDVVIFVPNKIKNNKKYYMSTINSINIDNKNIIC